jgi:predicted O-methyltransferase YrrM
MVMIDAAAEREEEDVFWPSFASGFDPAELSLLRDLRAHTERDFESRAHMLPTTSQGLLLSRLCDFSRATTVLEIGTFTGFSALCLAQSSSVERIVTIERDPELVDVVRTFAERSAYGSKIDVRCGAATDILDELREEGALFCLGYLDADKKRTRGLLEQLIGEGPLLRIGGLAIVDNVQYHGEVRRAARFVEEKGVGAVRCDPRREENMGSAMLDFLNATRDDTRVTQLILPAWDGVAICQRVE